MRLQVEHKLQTVLDLAKEAVCLVQNAILGVGQAADALQGRQRLEGAALADLREIAAVEQLQKLNRELDVAYTAVAGLDLCVALPAGAGAVLDAPLQGLDFVNFRNAEVFA